MTGYLAEYEDGKAMIAKVFHVLKWTPEELDRAIAALLEEGTVRKVKVEDTEQFQLAPAAVLECA